MNSKELTQVHVLIEGQVQGVGFRYFVRQAAQSLGLLGWVRNLSDGRVELLAQGTRKDCDLLLTRLKQGPRMSEVKKMETVWGNPTGEANDFSVKATAKGLG